MSALKIIKLDGNSFLKFPDTSRSVPSLV